MFYNDELILWQDNYHFSCSYCNITRLMDENTKIWFQISRKNERSKSLFFFATYQNFTPGFDKNHRTIFNKWKRNTWETWKKVQIIQFALTCFSQPFTLRTPTVSNAEDSTDSGHLVLRVWLARVMLRWSLQMNDAPRYKKWNLNITKTEE